MKHVIAYLIFCLFFQKLNAQINLVPNPSFEDTVQCGASILPVSFWTAIYGSPDYFNSVYHALCGYAGDVPNNIFGYQPALTGNAYMGFATYALPNGSNYREAIHTSLLDSLKLNKKYCVSFYVNLANNTKYASDDIGAYFSTSYSISFPLVAQINNPTGNFITDTVNWTLISGIMTAQGDEQYINIGNFKDDVTTTVIVNNPAAVDPETYYFIDDVSIYELPDIDAGINDSVYIGNSIQLNASCTGCWAGLQYRWYPTTGLNDSTVLNPIASPTQTTTYYFGLVDADKIPCMADYVDSVTVYVTGVGINELEVQSPAFNVYPNPASDVLNVSTLELTPSEIIIYDIWGRVVFKCYRSFTNGTDKIEIDVRKFSNGIYFVQEQSEHKVMSRKFVKE